MSQSLAHLQLVKQERQVYTDTIKKCKLALQCSPAMPPCTHTSFDFAQQVHVPQLPDQPGPLYFLTPYKLGIFGVSNEAQGTQVNFVIPESVLTGKGANAIISNYQYGSSLSRNAF